jgi:hypothetical protein
MIKILSPTYCVWKNPMKTLSSPILKSFWSNGGIEVGWLFKNHLRLSTGSSGFFSSR